MTEPEVEPEVEKAIEEEVASRLRRIGRRAFLGSLGGVALGAGAVAAGLELSSNDAPTITGTSYADAVTPFYGSGPQSGISIAPQQSSTYFAAFDVTTERRGELVELLRTWSAAAANLTAGRPAKALSEKGSVVEADTGEALGLGPARLSVNIGFGPGLFDKDGEDRFDIASRRPAALVELPRFPNDQLVEQMTGGDLVVQAYADDQQVVFHAVRQLVRLASGVAAIRWVQDGFNEAPAITGTPRNLMGFKDGTINPTTAAQRQRFVWVGSEGPSWMRAGTYLVARRIFIALDHWDQESLSVQQQVIGRYKVSGAPLGEQDEFDPLDLSKTDRQGNPVIPIDSHVRLSAPQTNNGRMFLRRGYNFTDGVENFTERWPPWKQELTYNAGLLFLAYQRDPRQGFIPIYQNLAENDALGQFTIHTGSAIAALPPAASGPGHFVGEGLFA